jgi:hypothetical protein
MPQAGSNRSASLRDPQSSLPVGTLSAIIVTSTIYLLSVVTYGSVASRCAPPRAEVTQQCNSCES